MQEVSKTLMAQAKGRIKMHKVPNNNKIIAEIKNFGSLEILFLFEAEMYSIRVFAADFFCLNFKM